MNLAKKAMIRRRARDWNYSIRVLLLGVFWNVTQQSLQQIMQSNFSHTLGMEP